MTKPVKFAIFARFGMIFWMFALSPEPLSAQALSSDDVGRILSQAATEAAARRSPAAIAVVDRTGGVLAVYQMSGANNFTKSGPHFVTIAHNPNGPDKGLNGGIVPDFDAAISKAVTAAYLSTSHGNAFTTRTASEIIQDHFLPNTQNAPSGPLYGVQFSQLPCSDLGVRFTKNATLGPHRSPLGLAGDPGGLPLYKDGALVGGVGAIADGSYGLDTDVHADDHSTDEIIALAGETGFEPPTSIRADHITVGGFLLLFTDVNSGDLKTNPAAAPPFSDLPAGLGGLISVPGYIDAEASPAAGVAFGTPGSGLRPSRSIYYEGLLTPNVLVDDENNPRYPVINGVGGLSVSEVHEILRQAYALSLQVRAQIRQPLGSAAALNIAVVDVDGTILGLVSNPDAALFGVDVSVQKARSALFLSSAGAGAALASLPTISSYTGAMVAAFGPGALSGQIAFSERSIANIARDSYPDGINGKPNGPLGLPGSVDTPFNTGLQLALVQNQILQHVTYTTGSGTDVRQGCTPLPAPAGSTTGLPILANGLQIFPGGFPIYRGNQLVGAIGVSGDGVDQDDLVGFLGLYQAGLTLNTGLHNAPVAIRASNHSFDGIAPRYVNCPFAPLLSGGSQELCSGK